MAMDDPSGTAIPVWARRLLQTIEDECAELEPRIAETKSSTAAKLVAFKNLKEKKEQEQEQQVYQETVRVNSEIMRRRDQATDDAGQFKAILESKIEETRQLETLLHTKSSSLPKLTDQVITLQSELEGLRKQEELQTFAYKKVQYEMRQNSFQSASSEIGWADGDLLEPALRVPELPELKWTATRADTATRTNSLARPTSSTEPRAESSSSSSQRNTRAGKSEMVRMLLTERPHAVIEVIFLQHRYVIQAIFESLNKIDPTDPIEPSTQLNIVKSIQNMHIYFGRDTGLIEWIMKQDISKANTARQVLVPGSISYQLISTFALRYGSSYLKDVLRDILFRVIKEDRHYELNPSKVVKNVEWLDLNIKSVKALAHEMLTDICQSHWKIPLQIRQVMVTLKNEMQKKFPQDGSHAVAAFLFDAFIGRSIEFPDQVNMDIKDVNDKIRTLLRVLSQMVVRTALNDPFSEDIHLPLNEFISNYLGLAKKFVAEALRVPDREIIAIASPYPIIQSVVDFNKGISELSLSRLDSISKRITELDASRLYNYPCLYYQHERLKVILDYLVNDKLATCDRNAPLLEDLLDVIFEEDGTAIDAVAEAVKKYPEGGAAAAQALINCSFFKDPTGGHAEQIIRNAIRKEISACSNLSIPQGINRVLNSFAAQLYISFSKALGKDLLAELITPLLENVRKGKYAKNDKKGCQALGAFIDVVILALNKVPLPMLRLAGFLTRQVMDVGPSLFLCKFLANGIDNHTKYMAKLPESGKEKEKFAKSLESIKLFFLRICTNEPLTKAESKYYNEANPFIKEVHDIWVAATDAWAPKENPSAPALCCNVTWEEARAGLKLITEIVDGDASIELLLSKQVKANLAFSLGDLFFGATAPLGSRTLSINPNAELMQSKSL